MRPVKYLSAGVISLALFASATAASAAKTLPLTALSTAPDRVSGGDVLVRLTAPPGVALSDLQITLDKADVTGVFRPDPGGQGWLGLVTGLSEGKNVLRASSRNGNPSLNGKLQLRNHPITGPIFSGPHETPFFCMTNNFRLPASTQTLGPPLDANCSVATRVDYVYRSNGSPATFKPLPSTTAYPTDLARTTTSLGKNVPYIVRVETGTIDRAIYQTAVLHDPIAEPTPAPTVPPAAWNHRLVYTLGGGCTGGWYIQGASIGNGASSRT